VTDDPDPLRIDGRVIREQVDAGREPTHLCRDRLDIGRCTGRIRSPRKPPLRQEAHDAVGCERDRLVDELRPIAIGCLRVEPMPGDDAGAGMAPVLGRRRRPHEIRLDDGPVGSDVCAVLDHRRAA